MPARFNIQAADAAAVGVLQRTLNLPRFIATTLVARGIDTPQKAQEFLSPSLERDWLNPYIIPGMGEVVDGLEAALRASLRILVFGDFDLDGISATTVLTRGLRVLGGDAVPFIPRRSDEGYGLTEAAIDRFMAFEPDVVITVDCGISCCEEVTLLQHRGVSVFITDHHEPGDQVPQDVPVCDPKVDSGNPSSVLAGVGVALKIVQALGARFGQPHLWREFTDIATLGTVADLVPLVGGNRALVADGVRRMNTAPRPAIAALLAAAGVANKPVAATSLSFSAIPRLNAAGRMGDAQVALDLLLEDDFDEASRKAARLEDINDQRRAIEAELAEIARLQAQEVYHGQRALVVSGEGWHEGVKGIVASRLVRTYGVPVILFAIDDTGEARGSGRSVGQVNLFKAVESCADLLTRFGGHEAAVGVTLPADKLPEFTERLCSFMDGLPPELFHPRIDIDAVIDLGELTLENIEKMEELAPFGQENRQPRFLAQGVLMTRSRAVGADKNHLSTTLSDGRNSIAGIMFHAGSSIESLLRCSCVVDAAFEVQIDEWRGRRSVKALLTSVAPAKPCCALESMIEPEHRSFVAGLFATDDDELCADCQDDGSECIGSIEAAEERRKQWRARAQEDPNGLRSSLVRSFIGEGSLFPSQQRVLDALQKDASTLAVMATGRGKSLAFQVEAARRALELGQASLLVYPLRALIADQAYHLASALDRFGIDVEVVIGSSTPEERHAVFDGIADGTVDIVLTTPEFLGYHAAEFARSGRIGFAVIDEAHHIGQARAGNRMAYASMGKQIAALGDPVVLALTATADARVASEIEGQLRIENRVLDDADRPNIQLDDQRNIRFRESYLANIIATGEKTVVYVNSRKRSVTLARELRKLVPQMAPFIGFYNAGLPRSDRERVEEMFRGGQMNVLISTSAFGEGVNIPDIRHVVLFHLPFNDVEFNQMSGRAGRDGEPACVHLLFGSADARINQGILGDSTPGHDTMAQVYRELKRLSQGAEAGLVHVSDSDLATACAGRVPGHKVAPASVSCAIAVFRELGLVETAISDTEDGQERAIRFVPGKSRVELTDSVRYREGLGEMDEFNAFCAWVMKSPVAVLLDRISRPILPSGTVRQGVPPFPERGDRHGRD